jgi:hypothetical protein
MEAHGFSARRMARAAVQLAQGFKNFINENGRF